MTVRSTRFLSPICTKGKRHHEAVRALSNIWVRIIFAMWQYREPYNRETFLNAQKAHQRKIA